MGLCDICGGQFEGEGTMCPSCHADALQTTTSFAPVTTDVAATVTPTDIGDDIALAVIKGPQMGEIFYLEGDDITIGRDPGAQLFLNDTTVSREHAAMVRIGDTIILRDQGSLNGTYLNGICIDEAELHDGDTVQIGTFHLMFRHGSRSS